ncbi:MAG: hypothetical protein JW913_07075, partial [Chitinispirillaceae bacterium]|nr:hypothetical protein [Chitinispirillaceae bacterium]
LFHNCTIFFVQSYEIFRDLTVYDAHCTVFDAHCFVYDAHCTVYDAHCTVYYAHCFVFDAHCFIHDVHCTVFDAHCFIHDACCSVYYPHSAGFGADSVGLYARFSAVLRPPAKKNFIRRVRFDGFTGASEPSVLNRFLTAQQRPPSGLTFDYEFLANPALKGTF